MGLGKAKSHQRCGFAYQQHDVMRNKETLDKMFFEAYEEKKKGNIDSALRIYNKAALLGDGDSCLNLGHIYDVGDGVEEDKDKALDLYKKAWRISHRPSSCNNIAIIYLEKGRMNLAIKWWNKAVDLGHGDAALSLAKLLLESGRRTDVERAKELLHFASTRKEGLAITPSGKEDAEQLLNELSR